MLQKRNLPSSGNLKLTINLIDALNLTFKDKNKVRAYRPLVKLNQFKTEFGERFIEEILNKLDAGSGVDESGDGHFATEKLKAYKKSYKESYTFKNYGKSNTVNLELTGDMRSSLLVLKTTDQGVVIGWDNPEQGLKARGHIVGDNPVLRKRDFFGLEDSKIKQILKDMIKDFAYNIDDLDFYIEAEKQNQFDDIEVFFE
jgi:hypothetical protein